MVINSALERNQLFTIKQRPISTELSKIEECTENWLANTGASSQTPGIICHRLNSPRNPRPMLPPLQNQQMVYSLNDVLYVHTYFEISFHAVNLKVSCFSFKEKVNVHGWLHEVLAPNSPHSTTRYTMTGWGLGLPSKRIYRRKLQLKFFNIKPLGKQKLRARTT